MNRIDHHVMGHQVQSGCPAMGSSCASARSAAHLPAAKPAQHKDAEPSSSAATHLPMMIQLSLMVTMDCMQ
jgi:hypothetical protein